MRYKFLIFFLIFPVTLPAQNGGWSYEFDYNFRDTTISYLDLTEKSSQAKRAQLKIQQIIKKVPGRSLDSIYLTDKKYYQKTIKEASFAHMKAAYTEIYNYDKYGLLMSQYIYPVCSYLTKSDSLSVNYFSMKYINRHDTIEVSKYHRDSLQEKSIYYKGRLLYDYTIMGELISDVKNHNLLEVNHKFVKTCYEYYKSGRMKSISNKDLPYVYNEILYEYENGKVISTMYYYDKFYKEFSVFKNEIVIDKEGKILKSTFYDIKYPYAKTVFNLYYDKHNKLARIDKGDYILKNESNFTYYEYENFYKKNKLIKTIVHYNFRVVENDVIYHIGENELPMSIEYQSTKFFFEYSFFKQ